MTLFRSRSRYGRLIVLGAILAGLYYLSSAPISSLSSSPFSNSGSSMMQWSQHNQEANPERPRPKMRPTTLAKKPHKTSSGRPARLGPGVSGGRSGSRMWKDPVDTDADSHSHDQESETVPAGKRHTPNSKPDEERPLPPPPPPGLHLPGTPGYFDPLERQFNSWKGEGYVPRPRPARKKRPEPEDSHEHDVPDPFPLLSRNPPPSLTELNLAATAQKKNTAGPETPLLIGFTRNWPQLLQCVVSYLAAGWPADQIWVVENTGTMHANRKGRLSLQNPFYLNHTQLGMLGVNVLVTPTLLSFAQLQNFYAWTALERNWTEFFWSHQDLLVFSLEDSTKTEDNSLHSRAAATLSYLRQPGVPKWANHFFAYDHLTLVHRDAILHVGGWDTHIPYYATDCDMYDRLMWAGYWQGGTKIGIILDVASVLDDVGALLRIPGIHASFHGDPGPEGEEEERKRKTDSGGLGGDQKVTHRRSKTAQRAKQTRHSKDDETAHEQLVDQHGETREHLVEIGRRMEAAKYTDGGGWRNMWQLRQSGGRGEPFYRDPEGFEVGLRMMIDTGRRVFAEKWGHRGCDIAQIGLVPDDAWKVERDWDPETEGPGSDGDDW